MIGYGAIAFYLDHQAEIDKYLEETEREFEENAIPLAQANPRSPVAPFFHPSNIADGAFFESIQAS